METLVPEISRLLNDTLSPEKTLVSSATHGLDQLSSLPRFPFFLLAIATGGNNRGLKIAAATYLKNLIRRHMEEKPYSPELLVEFRNQLVGALLQVEPAVLKVLVEPFRMIISTDFVKENSWPNFVPELKAVIQDSKLISQSECPQWNTINALIVLQTLIKPFQYFLNPTVPKEAVPSQLELIAKDILVPLLATFHHFVDKALSYQDGTQTENWQVLLIICKCMYFTARSYMPSAISPLLPSFCGDLFRILDSLSLNIAAPEGGYLLRLKTAKRTLRIICALVTRHRKHFDRLMPSFVTSAFRIARKSPDISILDSLSERIVSMAFDVISHILETGPGWRHVSPYFSSLLDSAIFPALALNQKDVSEWEEDTDEYIRKNLPSDLDEISGWADDLFTARKSAINLLGVIAMAKGPPVASAISKRKKGEKVKRKEQQSSIGELFVIPFLSKFPLPSAEEEASSKILQDYYGVLMAYGGLQDFLNEKIPDYTSRLVRNRVLPLYGSSSYSPYLVATANWVLGALAPCLPQAMAGYVYRCLMKSLAMPDIADCNCYPVRASAAGAIAELLENNYVPPDWLSLLQILADRIGSGDENESSLLFQLLSTVIEAGQEKVVTHIPVIVFHITGVITKNLPPTPEPWSKVVEHGFSALAVIAQTWEQSMPDRIQLPENKAWRSGWASIARIFSSLLQQAWVMPLETMEEVSSSLPPPSCVDDASQLLGFVMRFVSKMDGAVELKLTELLAVWAELIADWDAWEEKEDLAVFSSIQAVLNLHRRLYFPNYFMSTSQKLSGGLTRSILEAISAFVCKGIRAYPSATRRACSSVHAILHIRRFSFETEAIRQSVAVEFARASFCHFRDTKNKSRGLWKPLLLAISSCYIICPDNVKQVLGKVEDKGFTLWASALASISSSSFEFVLSSESENKLAVITLAKVVEHLLRFPSDGGNEILHDCFRSVMAACIRLKEVEEDGEDSDEQIDDDNDDEDDSDGNDDDEDSEDDEREETEQEFLDRYAKAAATLGEEMVEDGDSEDEAQELELGDFDEVDIETMIVSLLDRRRQVLLFGLPPSLVQRFINTCPEYSSFFCW